MCWCNLNKKTPICKNWWCVPPLYLTPEEEEERAEEMKIAADAYPLYGIAADTYPLCGVEIPTPVHVEHPVDTVWEALDIMDKRLDKLEEETPKETINDKMAREDEEHYNTTLAAIFLDIDKERIKLAIDVLTEAFLQDPELAYGWHCNLAGAFYDSMPLGVDHCSSHKVSNDAATRFMKHAFDVTTSLDMLSVEDKQ